MNGDENVERRDHRRARTGAISFAILALVFLIDALKTHSWLALGGTAIGILGGIVLFRRSQRTL